MGIKVHGAVNVSVRTPSFFPDVIGVCDGTHGGFSNGNAEEVIQQAQDAPGVVALLLVQAIEEQQVDDFDHLPAVGFLQEVQRFGGFLHKADVPADEVEIVVFLPDLVQQLVRGTVEEIAQHQEGFYASEGLSQLPVFNGVDSDVQPGTIQGGSQALLYPVPGLFLCLFESSGEIWYISSIIFDFRFPPQKLVIG
ncbi:MAG: hypothetical protein II873_02215 [Oscillospiraceae bacterium]|nr:hypothetical protein [Oscillospiraceae bacterium]